MLALVFLPEVAGVPPGAGDVLLSKVLTALSRIGLILLLMALVTTFMTALLVMRFMRGTELEPCILASGVVRPGGIPEEDA